MTERKRLAIDLDEPSKKKKMPSQPQKAAPDEIDINGGINPYTGRAYTEQFYTILEKRKQLPVLKFKPVSSVMNSRANAIVRRRSSTTFVDFLSIVLLSFRDRRRRLRF